MTRTRLQATEALAGPIGLLAAVCFAIASGVFGWERWWAPMTFFAILIAGFLLSLAAAWARRHWDVAPLEAQRALTAYGRENQRLATQAEWRKAVEDTGLTWIAWEWPSRPLHVERPTRPGDSVLIAGYKEFARMYGPDRPDLYGFTAYEKRWEPSDHERRARWQAYAADDVAEGLRYGPTAFERRQECEPPVVFDHQGR
jgi:hypothetical protein